MRSTNLRLHALLLLLLIVVAPASASSETRVYLMRGLFDVSTGLDDLAAKLKRSGVGATVASYTARDELATAAIARFKAGSKCPVVLVGHSLGADAAIGMARTLQGAGVPVGLLIAFSPAASDSVPANVGRVVNYYQSNSYWNNVYRRGPGFKGSLKNVDLARHAEIDHFNIEKVARLHAETIRAIKGVASACAPTARKETADASARE